jgi:hypothetical protein
VGGGVGKYWNKEELGQGIPPYFTDFIGCQLKLQVLMD